MMTWPPMPRPAWPGSPQTRWKSFHFPRHDHRAIVDAETCRSAFLDEPKLKLQHLLSRCAHASVLNDLKAHLAGMPEPEPPSRHNLQWTEWVSERDAIFSDTRTSLIFAATMDKGGDISRKQFITIARYHLLLPPLPRSDRLSYHVALPTYETEQCHRGSHFDIGDEDPISKRLDRFGNHQRGCNRAATCRSHKGVQAVIEYYARKAGFDVTHEPQAYDLLQGTVPKAMCMALFPKSRSSEMAKKADRAVLLINAWRETKDQKAKERAFERIVGSKRPT